MINKLSFAVQGWRAGAVFRVQTSGLVAWRGALIHLQFLATPGLRLSVFLQWAWTQATGQRGSRLIVNHHASAPASPAVEEAVRGAA